MTITEAYKLGFDCGKNGANKINSHFSIFSDSINTWAWEDGKKDGEKERTKNPDAVALGKLSGEARRKKIK